MKTIVLIILLLATSICIAQKDSLRKRFFIWGSLSGHSTFSDHGRELGGYGFGLHASIKQNIFFSAYSSFHNPWIDLLGSAPPHTLTRLQNNSLLVGRGFYPWRFLCLSLQAGLSFGSGTYKGDLSAVQDHPDGGFVLIDWDEYDYENFEYVGVPLHLKAHFTVRYFGVSLEPYYNFHKHPDYGVILAFNFGIIRSRE